MPNYATITSDKSKAKALQLCKTFGWMGAHHYYVGKIGTGIIYTFTLGLMFIGWALDIARIANGTFRDNAGAPLRE